MDLLPYQSKLDVVTFDLFNKKAVLTAYLNELESRMWESFEKQEWTRDKETDEAKAKEIVIELSKQINNEWNNQRTTKDSWMEHSGFIKLASVMFDFPIKLVPVMR